MLLTILIYCLCFLFFAYTVLIFVYLKWFNKLKQFVLPTNYLPQQFFSIVIPARNEEYNIINCLNSIFCQNYPSHLYEVIVIDDFSTDNTNDILVQFKSQFSNLQIIKLEDEIKNTTLNSYKKKAIELAVHKSRGNWIVTTDADCIVPSNWLTLYDAYIQKTGAVFVAAPVQFSRSKTILSEFQYIDFLGMQAITAASVSAGFHSMCNGANLAYSKVVFKAVNGFTGIDNIASGDDMLLMQKIKEKYPNKMGYLFSNKAIVSTLPANSWKAFLNQRIRWASKADQYNDKTVFWVLLLVYMVNLGLMICIVAAFFSLFFLKLAIAFLLLKTIVEYSFIFKASTFFSRVGFFPFLLLQPLHIIYIILAGWLGKFGKYTWKDRKVH